jgi:hypothetical protein
MPGKFAHPEFYEGRSKKPLTHDELNMIKRKLNIPQVAPFNKCPSKSEQKLRILSKAGEKWHRDPKHAPCSSCTCNRVAGMGTPHYGYGYCYHHEIGKSFKRVEQMAKADLRAHQQRHPRVFRNAQEYLVKTEAEGKDLKDLYDFTAEMGKARDLVHDINDRMTAYEKDREGSLRSLAKDVSELKDMISLSPTGLSAEEKLLLEDTLIGIWKKLTCPLTEKGSGGPVEMCDKTRYELQLESADTLTRISERVQKLQAIDMITKESLKVWLTNFLQHLKREFGTLNYTREDGTKPIIEGIGECMRITGEPKRGI